MPDSPGILFDSLLDLMTRLRGADGCPWDREQTRRSLQPYLIEEAYEAVEAIDGGQRDAMLEELGDLLFQVVFHAQIARELGEFAMTDILERLLTKMVRRHPHVFGEGKLATPAEALAQWERIKREEASSGSGPRSALEGVPRSLPALLRAQRIQEKAARVGFDWKTANEAWSKVREEAREVEEALGRNDQRRIGEELGDLLFATVNVARLLGVDAEGCLQQALEKFRGRFARIEAEFSARGTCLSDASREEMDRSWEESKSRERDSGRPETGSA